MGKKNDVVEEIIEEAREGFDLRARLMGATRREKTVTVYTDSATGHELGGAEDIITPRDGLKSGLRRRWGVAGELDEVSARAESLSQLIRAGQISEEDALPEIEELEAKRAELTAKAKKLLKKLQSSALDFTLHAVPDLVIRDARRQARKNLGIKNKGNEGREEEYGLEYTAIMLAASVSEWTDRESGKTFHILTVEQARELKDLLPFGQFDILDAAMVELSMESAISHSSTDDLDF